MTSPDFGELRSMMNQKPSEALVYRIWKTIGSSGALEERALDYMADHMARWPRELARKPMSAWTDRAAAGEDVPALALCNSFVLEKPAESTWFESARIRSVDMISINRWNGVEALEWFLGFDHSPRIMELSSCNLNVGSIEKLSEWSGLQGVHRLNLARNSFGAEGVDVLSRSSNVGAVEELVLAMNTIGELGATRLAKTRAFKSLRELDLRFTKIGAEGASVLAGSRNLRKLEWLHIHKSDTTSKGMTALKRSEHLAPHIRSYLRAQ